MNQYHDFSKANVISFDLETRDPDLLTMGPSIKTGGYVLGVALADDQGFSEYYNLGHDDCQSDERETNIEFLKEVMDLDIPKLGQNIIYDLDWIENFLDIRVKGKLWDVMCAESLINENQLKYNLDYMAEKYLDRKKYKDDIDEFCEQRNLKGDSRKWLWMMPSTLVAQYAIQDVLLPLQIFQIQWKVLNQQNLLTIFHMEMQNMPLLIQMRKTGVMINEKKLSIFENEMCDLLIATEADLYAYAGFELNYNSGDSIGKVCDKVGIRYPLTPKTRKPSITKPWLEANENMHPFLGLVLKCRKYNKLITTFLESQIRGQLVDGVIYGQFHPFKKEMGGTVTGRFSASNPNLQFIPNPKSYESDDPEEANVGKEMRSLFIPFPGHKWGKIDYSQIEFRLFIHYAVGPKSDELRETYNVDPNIDFHQWCGDESGTTRKKGKTVNFGLIFGMGLPKLCAQLGMNEDEGAEFLSVYFDRFPFMKKTLYAVKNKAERMGYVKTILGRRRRFPDKNFSYKALNAVIQGSAADVMKKSMRDAWEAGIYDTLVPLLTVHDEMDVSIPQTKEGEEAFRELKNIMEQTVKISVPIIADMELGNNWGYLEDYE